METIVLKKKKKIKLNVKLLLASIAALILIIALVWFNLTWQLAYEYYVIYPTGGYATIGYALDRKLVEKSIMEEIETTYNQKLQIVDYNLKTYVSNRRFFIRRNTANDEWVKENIKNFVYITVYANILELEDKTYYLQTDKAYNTLYSLREINPKITTRLLRGTYVNRDLLLTDEEIKKILENYEKKFA